MRALLEEVSLSLAGHEEILKKDQAAVPGMAGPAAAAVMNRADAKKQREVLAAHPRDTCRPNVSRFSGQRSGPLLKCFVLVSCATRFEPAAQRILTLA